jgi:hypothetical protein
LDGSFRLDDDGGSACTGYGCWNCNYRDLSCKYRIKKGESPFFKKKLKKGLDKHGFIMYNVVKKREREEQTNDDQEGRQPQGGEMVRD